MIYLVVTWLIFLGSCGYALALGGRPERTAALMFLAAAIGTRLVQSNDARDWARLQVPVLVVDALLLAGLLAIVIRYDRWWTLFAAASHAIAVLAHLARVRQDVLSPIAYSLMESIPFMAVPVLLIVGTENHRRRTRSASLPTSSDLAEH